MLAGNVRQSWQPRRFSDRPEGTGGRGPGSGMEGLKVRRGGWWRMEDLHAFAQCCVFT